MSNKTKIKKPAPFQFVRKLAAKIHFNMSSLKIIIAIICCTWCSAEQDLDLPAEHVEYHLKTSGKCWGYEDNCKTVNSFSQSIECETQLDPYTGRISRDVFFDEADFGYVRSRLQTMMSICEPRTSKDSSLVCSQHLQFCFGRKIFFDFTDLPARKTELLRYR